MNKNFEVVDLKMWVNSKSPSISATISKLQTCFAKEISVKIQGLHNFEEKNVLLRFSFEVYFASAKACSSDVLTRGTD